MFFFFFINSQSDVITLRTLKYPLHEFSFVPYELCRWRLIRFIGERINVTSRRFPTKIEVPPRTHCTRVRARTGHELIPYWPVTNIVICVFMTERCRSISFFVFISLKATFFFINVINVHYKRFRSYSYFLYSISLNGVILV